MISQIDGVAGVRPAARRVASGFPVWPSGLSTPPFWRHDRKNVAGCTMVRGLGRASRVAPRPRCAHDRRRRCRWVHASRASIDAVKRECRCASGVVHHLRKALKLAGTLLGEREANRGPRAWSSPMKLIASRRSRSRGEEEWSPPFFVLAGPRRRRSSSSCETASGRRKRSS